MMFKPAAIFSDRMVLVRGREVRIFGEAENGAAISAVLKDGRGECIAKGSAVSRDGRFLLRLPPLEAATGLCLILSDGRDEKTYSDVTVGDVFLAGGQSNMELELQNADEGQQILKVHNDPDLRFYNVPKQPVWNEAAIKAENASAWKKVAPGECRDVSAVAYFCAAQLRKTKNVPIGIIDCYWGGTSASCWMDEEALRRTEVGQFYLAQYEAMYGHKSPEQFDLEQTEYDARLAAYNRRVEECKAKNPAITASQLNDEAGLYPWPPPAGCKSPYRPAGLAETMLRRVVPYSLTGMLYYQGEEDSSRPNGYEALLTSMVQRWREWFMDEELPFINVQLPMFIGKDAPDDKTWPIIRQAQHRVWRKLRNTGLTVLIDCGEYDNIHPTDKRTPGERLCQQVLRVVYGDETAPESPRALQKQTVGSSLIVTLTAPVTERKQGDELFEIAGEDGIFYPAKVQIHGCSIALASEAVPLPVMARYAWVNYGIVRIFGENGLPLAPFCLR